MPKSEARAALPAAEPSTEFRGPASASARRQQLGLLAAIFIFLTGLTFNVIQTSGNLDTGYLAGHEFRQAQTALSILFIQKEDDYGLAYPTPVFGPPWSIPMEFPLYQWTAAKLSTITDTSIQRTARLVALVCFYLTLPGGFLLLRRFGANRQTALLALSLVLFAPIYVFYSRAILIESMALCLSVWFLVAFEVVRRRHSWLATLLTAALGGLATLVKITTFAVWGGIALALGVHEILRLMRKGSRHDSVKFMAQASIGGLVPLISGWAWVRYADAIKAASPGGFFLTSEQLEDFNLGGIADRVEPELWTAILQHSSTGLLPGLGLVLLVGLWLLPTPGNRSRVAVWLLVATTVTLMTFPNLYRIHDYYLYAVGMLPLAALALALQRFGVSRNWFWLPAVIVIGTGFLQWRNFNETYKPGLKIVSSGGDPFFDFLRDVTSDEEVIVVVGDDWSATVPYYTQRRVVMIKKDIHDQPGVLDRIVASLKDHSVSGLLLLADPAAHAVTVEELAKKLGLDPAPVFKGGIGFFHPYLGIRGRMNFDLKSNNQYSGISSLTDAPIVRQTDPIIADSTPQEVTLNQAQSVFSLLTPSPVRYQAQFGFDLASFDTAVVLGAHADTDLWFPWNAPEATFALEFGLQPPANEDAHNHSDGVWFRVWGMASGEADKLLWERWIDPWNDVNDRGLLRHTFRAPTTDYSEIRLSIRSGPSNAYDSAFWGTVTLSP